MERLHLGCGLIHIPGYCNVDVLKTPAVDVISDITELEGFPPHTSEQIYACHVLEHFPHEMIEPILRRWRELLKPGGEIRISVPDLDQIVKQYAKHWDHFQTPGNTPWIGLIYGGQKDVFDYHKTGFNFCWLSNLLERSGFRDPQRYPNDPHFISGVVDASLANAPFNEFLSLNVVARR